MSGPAGQRLSNLYYTNCSSVNFFGRVSFPPRMRLLLDLLLALGDGLEIILAGAALALAGTAALLILLR